MSDPLYQEFILDLFRHPRNKQPLADFDVKQHLQNPLCSDEIDLFIKFDADQKVAAVGFQGEGCAISQAGASLFTDYIKGKTRAEITALTPDTALELLGLGAITPARVGCATLAFKAAERALKATPAA